MRTLARPLVFLALAVSAKADIAADFASITGTIGGQTVTGVYYPCNIARHGKAAFPILRDADSITIMAAGRYGDNYASTAARAVTYGNSAAVTTNPLADPMATLLVNSVLWASRKTTQCHRLGRSHRCQRRADEQPPERAHDQHRHADLQR